MTQLELAEEPLLLEPALNVLEPELAAGVLAEVVDDSFDEDPADPEDSEPDPELDPDSPVELAAFSLAGLSGPFFTVPSPLRESVR